jgi:hypothetical protein
LEPSLNTPVYKTAHTVSSYAEIPPVVKNEGENLNVKDIIRSKQRSEVHNEKEKKIGKMKQIA